MGDPGRRSSNEDILVGGGDFLSLELLGRSFLRDENSVVLQLLDVEKPIVSLSSVRLLEVSLVVEVLDDERDEVNDRLGLKLSPAEISSELAWRESIATGSCSP